MEIAPNVHRIPCVFMGDRVAYVHLLVGEEASILLDTCCAHNPAQEILPYMERIGFDRERLSYIIISHSDLDHQGGNAPMKAAAPHAKMFCHALDRPWIESTEAIMQGRYLQFDAPHGLRTPPEDDRGNARIDTILRAGWHARGWRALSPRAGLVGARCQHTRPYLRTYRVI